MCDPAKGSCHPQVPQREIQLQQIVFCHTHVNARACNSTGYQHSRDTHTGRWISELKANQGYTVRPHLKRRINPMNQPTNQPTRASGQPRHTAGSAQLRYRVVCFPHISQFPLLQPCRKGPAWRRSTALAELSMSLPTLSQDECNYVSDQWQAPLQLAR